VEEINKVNTALAIVLIALAVILVGGLGATRIGTTPTTLQKAFAESQRPDRLAGSDRCVTSQDQSTDTTTSTCFFGTDKNAVKEASKEANENCKDARQQGEVDKCSSSQTGNGEFCNWVRVHKDIVIMNFGFEPPCNDIVQK
jgi:hypothetical protein